MNTRVVARAPGKLFVLGEYAVLDGCPAVVAAIDRTVEVALEMGSPGTNVRINSAVASGEFSTTALPTEVGPLGFAVAALRSALAAFPEVARRSPKITVVSHLERLSINGNNTLRDGPRTLRRGAPRLLRRDLLRVNGNCLFKTITEPLALRSRHFFRSSRVAALLWPRIEGLTASRRAPAGENRQSVEQQRMKLGLGSSAAVVTGVIAAVFAAAGQDLKTDSCRDLLFAVALDAHRRVQGSLGSGADVAASVYGGLVLFRPRDGMPQVTPLRFPPHARLLAAWTGEPASTPDLVQRYRSAQDGSAAQRAAFVQATRACVDDFVAGLGRGAVPLSAVAANGRLLEQFAADLSLPLVTPSLSRLVSIARAEGAAAKISGAGGGDCGIAITCGEEAAQRVRAAWYAARLYPLDLSISDQGVSATIC